MLTKTTNRMSIRKNMSEKTIRIIEKFEKHHNHSWFEELYERNKNTLDDTALFYRGNIISYGEMFEKMRMLASSMQEYGIHKGNEIPVCMSNVPELVYVMGAASMLGAKINVFSDSFPSEYVTEIVNNCNSCIGIFEDNRFARIETAIKSTKVKTIVLYSLSDSLAKSMDANAARGQCVNFESSVDKWKAIKPNVTSFYDFLNTGNGKPVLNEPVTLNDDFTITYTSGSTNALRPKAIVQRVRSFCVIGRFHDPDVMYGMKFKKVRGMAIIPPYSNTDLISCISDTLMQGAELAMEPVYNESFFFDALMINQPSFAVATRSFWITAMKRAMVERNQGFKMPFLLLAFSVGEELSINEEKFLNRALRKLNAGRSFHHLPVSPICFCTAGGDCEHGSILMSVFRAITNFTLVKSSDKRYGMKAFDFVDIAVLDAEGNRLGANQVGKLVANSPCTMRCYKNDPEGTKDFFVVDHDGHVWGDMGVYGYMDKSGRVYMRNRIVCSDQDIPPFRIADIILRCREILSCEVVYAEERYIAHVEFMPGYMYKTKDILKQALRRVKKELGESISDKTHFRIHSGAESFQLTGSGKRDVRALISEGTARIEML